MGRVVEWVRMVLRGVPVEYKRMPKQESWELLLGYRRRTYNRGI